MTQPLQFFGYRNGKLSTDGIPLDEVARLVGTPAYVYSADAFLTPLREIQKGLESVDHLVCFAVKANSNVAILKMLADAGAGTDLVSGGELYRAEMARVPGERVVLSGVGKTAAEMERGLQYGGRGILSFNVESVAELATLSQVAARLGKKASVALRYNPNVDAKTHPYISTGLKKNKFGMDRKEILAVARDVSQYPGISFDGLSIHIGSQLLSLAPLDDAFALTRELVAQLDRLLPTPLSRLDLGGGVGITYKNEKSPPLKKYCALILKHFGPKAKLPFRGKLILEPGRTLSGNSGVLLTEVLYRKARATKDFIVVDAAMNDLLRPALYGSYHEIIPVKKPASGAKTRKTDVVGPVCESSDCFGQDRKLPAQLGSGDLLAILSAGAYGFTMASTYNSRPRPAEVLIEGGSVRVIRRRESYEDLVRGESV
jgi:diaminopimelate decarboxylase